MGVSRHRMFDGNSVTVYAGTEGGNQMRGLQQFAQLDHVCDQHDLVLEYQHSTLHCFIVYFFRWVRLCEPTRPSCPFLVLVLVPMMYWIYHDRLHQEYMEKVDTLKRKVLKLESIVDAFVDTSICSRCVTSFVGLCRDTLLIYAAVKVPT
jgi:hypothetical protein